MVLSLLCHNYLHFCPFALCIVHRDDEKPVLYGYVIPDYINPAWRDKVTLGGCVVMPISTTCPHCGEPMRYCDPTYPDTMPDLDVNAMFAVSLSEPSQRLLRAHVDKLKSIQLDGAEERIIAAAMDNSGLWLSARYQGLYRMDRHTGVWTTKRDGPPWTSLVKSITISKDSVNVEYCPFGPSTYFQTAVTRDEGKTWRLMAGALPL